MSSLNTRKVYYVEFYLVFVRDSQKSPRSMAAIPELPPCLKPLKPYLTHAQQLDKHDPIMAYYCASC